MAKQNQCLGIDIGTHSIRVAEVAAGPKGIEIRKLVETRIQLEPGQRDTERQTAIVKQLAALLKENKIKTKSAVFCVPGQTVFVRPTVKIPATSPDRLNQIIRFEAREQIPFPLEKTNLEYQVFETDDPGEVEVLLVAIRRDHINQFMALVRRSGLKPLAVSVSSLALHNFHEANDCPSGLLKRLEPAKKARKGAAKGKQSTAKPAAAPSEPAGPKKMFGITIPKLNLPALGRKKKPGEEPPVGTADTGPGFEEEDPYSEMALEEIQAEVNLGASLTDLAISKAGSRRLIGFTRTFPVAGNQMDRSIRTKLGLESAEDAQRIKEQQAVILSTDFSGHEGGFNQNASSAATAAADSIITEIRRSLDYYISQPDGVAVDKLALSGGLARMRHLTEYIEEKLGVPVAHASVTNSSIEIPDELKETVSAYVIPIGLAFQGLGLAQVQIDFLPQEFKNIRQFKQKRRFIVAAAIMAAVSAGLGTQLGSRYMEQNTQLAEKYRRYVENTKAETEEINTALRENVDLSRKFGELSRVQTNRALWLDFTLNLLQRRPAPILIERIEISPQGIVDLQGLTTRQQAITEFYNELKQETEFIQSAQLVSLQAPIDDSRFGTRVFPFTMRITTFNRQGRFESIKRNADGSPLGTVQAVVDAGAVPGEAGAPAGEGAGTPAEGAARPTATPAAGGFQGFR